MSGSKKHTSAIHWFRKGLRLHDNPALLEACTSSSKVYPVFIIDPWFAKPEIIGINRYSFLLESLADLDKSLRSIGSRLYVAQGKPEEQLPILIEKWGVKLLTFEKDTEPYAILRDNKITASLSGNGVKVSSFCSHTLFESEHYVAASQGKVPTTYGAFCKLFLSMGKLRQPIATITSSQMSSSTVTHSEGDYLLPTLAQMGYSGPVSHKFPGGETEALKRMKEKVTDRPLWACEFKKPETSPNSLEPSTTVLSPYLKFGCISPSLFYHELAGIYKTRSHSEPPQSLHGQLLWREFFYLSGVATPNFDKMKGNALCKQIPWDNDQEKYLAFKEGRTGYPFIDAIMAQLRTEGWIHHLARHSVACFFTRGDLWQSWEKGAEIFDFYLLDSDWAVNNANWQWLSCSRFFHQYYRCYSPVAFGKKSDANGDYIRKYLPQLAKYPAKFIYEPWKAPLSVQQDCGCVIGKGYPKRIVDHDEAVKENMGRMKAAYASQGGGDDDGGDDEDEKPSKSSSSAKITPKGKAKLVSIADLLSPPQKKKNSNN